MSTERLPLKPFPRNAKESDAPFAVPSAAYSVLEAVLMLAAMCFLLVMSCLAFGWERLMRRGDDA